MRIPGSLSLSLSLSLLHWRREREERSEGVGPWSGPTTPAVCSNHPGYPVVPVRRVPYGRRPGGVSHPAGARRVHVEPVPHGSAGGRRRQPGWLDPTKGQLPPTSPLALFSNGGERERERERERAMYTQFFFRTLHLTASSKTTSFQRGLRFFLVSA